MHSNSTSFRICLSIACICYTMDDLKNVVILQREGTIEEGIEENNTKNGSKKSCGNFTTNVECF